MKRNKKEIRIHLTDHFTYQIIDNVIYLFEEDNSSVEEIRVVFKKILLLIDDGILYINLSTKNMEERKDYYRDLGFSLSYYSVDKLNELYKGYRDKKAYRCYGMMTKNDFFNINKKEDKKVIIDNNKVVEENYNKGFVSSMFLLFSGIVILCYLAIEGAILLVK